MTLPQLTVRTRLAFGFGIVVALLAAVALTSLYQLARFNRGVEALASGRMVQLITVAQAGSALAQITRNTGNVLILDDEKQVKEELVSARRNQALIRDLLAVVEKAVAPGREKELFADIAKARAASLPPEEEFLKTAEAGDYSTAKDVLLKSARPAQLKLIEALGRFDQYQVAVSAEEARDAANAYQTTRTSIVGLSLVAVVFAIAAAMLIIRALRRELGGEPRYAKEVASLIAHGDLTLDVQVARGDDRSLLYAMKQMVQNLRELVGEVAGGARTVSATSGQIAQGNVELSQRTEEQASTLEETASSMEQLTSTITQNAENARQASKLAVEASDVARRGGSVVGEVVATMTGISDSSKKIADIIGVIDAIAFQTNILALNAAVEAARAGEQGRGFAVVAAEVRSLAQRSAAAAKEIKTLIGDSVDKVEAGTRLVDAAGKTMQEIVDSVKTVSDLIAEIAAASREQSSGVEQVSTAVSQMDKVVQQNASLVEEATAATDSMNDQAGTLLQMVSRFKLGGEQARVERPRSDPARTPAPIPTRPGRGAMPAQQPTLEALLAVQPKPNREWKAF
jgi:methyl-accepting chemotaxis protein